MIQSEVLKRDIKHVFHFTKIENLLNILNHGLISKDYLITNKIHYNYNDELRLDGCTNATCHSISFPSYRMFYKYRKNTEKQEWIVLSLSPKILWEKDCAFCYTNAASSEIKCIPLSNRKGPEAFIKLFQDFDQYPTKRSVLKIDNSLPTNPQAEVLVFEPIGIEYFQGILFDTFSAMNRYKKDPTIENKIPCVLCKNAFGPRKDYYYWKNQ